MIFKNKYLLIFFTLICVKTFSQYKINYEVTFIKDSLKENERITEEMSLYLKNNNSLYISDKKIKFDNYFHDDNNLNENSLGENNIDISKISKKYPLPSIKHTIKKNKEHDTIYTRLNSTTYLLKEKSDFKNWKLTNEESTFLDYKIKKATIYIFGRNWEAWYTEDIPISDGPYRFRGLPGLILKLTDADHYFTFETISIVKFVDFPLLRDLDEVVPSSAKEFKIIYSKRDQELIDKFKNLNIKKSNISMAELEKRIEKKMNSENIFLEADKMVNY